MKRDLQGKFALKNETYRSVRSLRLTDATWEALGTQADSLGMTRADLLEHLVRSNSDSLPGITRTKDRLQPSSTWQLEAELPSITRVQEVMEHVEEIQNHACEDVLFKTQVNSLPSTAELEVLRDQVLYDLKLGKQAPGFKAALKALNRFISYLRSRP